MPRKQTRFHPSFQFLENRNILSTVPILDATTAIETPRCFNANDEIAIVGGTVDQSDDDVLILNNDHGADSPAENRDGEPQSQAGATGKRVRGLNPYPGFHGGVRVASGDVNGDGTPDIITAPGPGSGPHVRVFNGEAGREVRSFFAFRPNFTG